MNSKQRSSRRTYGLSATEKKNITEIPVKHGLNGLNAGYTPGLISTASTILIIITLLRIESNVALLQLLQSAKFPFLGILMMVPQTAAGVSRLQAQSSPLKVLPEMHPVPGPCYSALMTLIASCRVGVSVPSRSSSGGGMSGQFSGSGLFRTSVKCSVHLWSCI